MIQEIRSLLTYFWSEFYSYLNSLTYVHQIFEKESSELQLFTNFSSKINNKEKQIKPN